MTKPKRRVLWHVHLFGDSGSVAVCADYATGGQVLVSACGETRYDEVMAPDGDTAIKIARRRERKP